MKIVSSKTLTELERVSDIKFTTNGSLLLKHATVDGKGELFLTNQKGQIHHINGELDVRGGIGYGGGEFDIGKNYCVFSTNAGGLFLSPLEPPFFIKQLDSNWKFTSSASLSNDEDWVMFIYSDNDNHGLAINKIEGGSKTSITVSGSDFYMQPTWHPTGKWIAWVEWDHPNMPWDASRINIGSLNISQWQVKNIEYLAGALGQSASQPLFSPDGKWMSYIIRNEEWDDLVLYDLDSKKSKILVRGNGYHLRLPEWVQGMRSYGWGRNSLCIYYFGYRHAATTLWKVEIADGLRQQINIDPITWATQLEVSLANDELVFLGSSPAIPKQVCRLTDGQLVWQPDELHEKLVAKNLHAEALEFSTSDGQHAFGLYYPPDESLTPDKSKSPLIIHIHGGPTAVADLGFNPDAAFFTSRGYGFAEINYRGSSTFGYSYQEALRHNWGVVDVQDTMDFAINIINKGLADPDRIILFGSSAGGFTILNILIQHPAFYKGGICSYAVSDLIADIQTTHKFEKFYHHFLTGDPQKEKETFLSRSPINHVEKIKDPLLLFHGDQDKVVDIAQTNEIFYQLTKQGVPCEMKIYPGEGHGFRKFETITDYYQSIEEFLKLHFG